MTNVFCIAGIFHPPVKGTYGFTMYALYMNNPGWMFLRKNDHVDDILCKIWVKDNNADASACAAIVSHSLADP